MSVIDRLSTASLRRVIEPDLDLPGHVSDGQVLPDELLGMHELAEFADLSADQRAKLSREEVASIVEAGLRFEAVLMAGFALSLVDHPDLTDPEVVYALHEIGEETRHSRLFSRLLGQLAPTAKNPLAKFRRIEMMLIPRLIRRPATLDVLVLGGEEIPDLMQKRAGGASRHRPVPAPGQPLPPCRGSPPPGLRPSGAAPTSERGPQVRPLPGASRRAAHHLGDVRHDRASWCLRHRRPAAVRHVKARQPHPVQGRAAPRGDSTDCRCAAAIAGYQAGTRAEAVASTRRRRRRRTTRQLTSYLRECAQAPPWRGIGSAT